MLGLYIQKLKEFTNQLFLQNTFDSFLVSEACFTTAFTTTIDGALTAPEGGEAYISWAQLKPFAFSLIRGRTLPRSFSLVFVLSQEKTAELLSAASSSLSPEELGGLFLNIRYAHEQLSVTSGVSLRVFSPDKSLEQFWDKQLLRFFEQNGLS